MLLQLTEAEGFELFCQKRYVTTKRFGLEGGEITIPALHAIIGVAAAGGVVEVAIGMPHRGRLNTLVNIVKKPLTALFSEFGGESFKPDDVQGSGDVKYHLGTSTDVEIAGHAVHLSLQPNPSHLEAVDPVVVGKVRARQDRAGDTKMRGSVMAVLMHGDAAFAGQGLVQIRYRAARRRSPARWHPDRPGRMRKRRAARACRDRKGGDRNPAPIRPH